MYPAPTFVLFFSSASTISGSERPYDSICSRLGDTWYSRAKPPMELISVTPATLRNWGLITQSCISRRYVGVYGLPSGFSASSSASTVNRYISHKHVEMGPIEGLIRGGRDRKSVVKGKSVQVRVDLG